MGEEILILVIQGASQEQLTDWLRVPREVSASDEQIWYILSKRNKCCQFRRHGEELLSIVMEKASPEQWVKWLQIPLEHARLAGKTVLEQKLLAAGKTPSAGGGVAGWADNQQPQQQQQGKPAVSTRSSAVPFVMRETGADSAQNMSCCAESSSCCVKSSQPKVSVVAPSSLPPSATVYAAAAAAAATATTATYSVCGEPTLAVPSISGADVADVLPSDAATVAARVDEQLALHRATMAGDVKLMVELLIAGVDKHATDLWSCTALHRAAEQDGAEAVQLLLTAGLDVGARDMEGYTPLHFAAARSACTCLVDLLKAGACVSDRGLNGDTPLHSAVRFLSLSTVRLLLEWDSDESATNVENKTPRDVTGVLPDGREIEDAPDPVVAQEILAALAGAPARRRSRIWKRRAWVVMLRARSSARSKAQIRASPAGNTMKSASFRSDGITYASPHVHNPVKLEQLEKLPRCSANGICVGSGDEDGRFRAVVKRTTNLTEDGIFQKIVQFL